MKPVVGITQRDIVRQWDMVARLRAEQIRTGKDLSFNFVLVPTILQLSASSDFTSVIDIGCGTGFLTEQLASKAQRIIGIDMSEEMIKFAKDQCIDVVNVEFKNSTIENFARNIKSPLFTLAISNMSLMTALNLDVVLQSIACVLRPGGHFVFTITHPCFWPFYHGYAYKEWFDYKKEVLIEDVFRISLESPKDGIKTTHAHRPLEQYMVSLYKAGFAIDGICEPMPTRDIEVKYPEPWEYPRFLGVRCIKVR